jgi:Flp pilus assembly protein TadB
LSERNEEFIAKVRSAPRPRPPAPGGKGSPAALLTIGVIGTALLGVCAAALGGGLLYVPAAIPLVTVLAVLVSRRLSEGRASRQA